MEIGIPARGRRWPDVLLPVVQGDVAGELVHELGLPGAVVKAGRCSNDYCVEVTYDPGEGVTVSGGPFTKLEWALFLVGCLDGDFDFVKLEEEWKAKQGQ